MSCVRPPRRESIGTASMAASAPPNSLTSAQNVAGPTFSLRIRRSQASRWRRLSLTVAPLRGALGAALANPRLLASRQPPDVRGVADVEQHGEQKKQRRELPVVGQSEQGKARSARTERGEGGIARGERNEQPDRAEGDACGPIQPEQDADVGRNALAATKAEPDGKEMAEKGAKSGQDGGLLAPMGGNEHGAATLGRIENERRRSKLL